MSIAETSLARQEPPQAAPAAARDAGPARGDALFQCLAWIGALHGDERSVTAWRHGVPNGGQPSQPQEAVRAALQAGYVASLVRRAPADLAEYVLPAIVLLRDDEAAVLVRRLPDGRVEAAMPESDDALLPAVLPMEELTARATGFAILVKPRLRADDRAGAPVERPDRHWFWGTLWRYRSYYANTVLAALLINTLTLAGTFFTMNVYDRVVPTRAYPTLWSLAVGTLLAMVLEYASRLVRSELVDVAGKKADLMLGSALFRQAMDVRLESRPASSGAFAYRLREFESVREFTTSATVSALTDLPFALVFLAVIVAIGGPLAWVPALAMLAVVGIGLAVQWPLARHMRENLREGALKHGLLIEALDGIETLKALNGQSRMQKSWEDYSAAAATSFTKTRALTSWAMSTVGLVQQLATVVVVVWGVHLIHAGQLSMGALVAVVLLARQAVSPLGQVTALAVRFQQARASLRSLDRLMAEPVDRQPGRTYLSRERFGGALQTSGLSFTYPESKLPALQDVSLSFAPGERVAVLGRIGSGKSTLLRMLAGLYQPGQGSVSADGIDLRQIEPADVHRNVSLVTQDCKLFYGTLRDNLVLGLPQVSNDRLLTMCRITGLDAVVARHPRGLDMMLGEGGAGLSGGQRQLVALARALLPDPAILLMDEPTSAMDAQTEAAFIARLRQMGGRQTLVIATHRMSLLELTSRVIVLDHGKVIADGPREKLLQVLTTTGLPAQPTREPAHA